MVERRIFALAIGLVGLLGAAFGATLDRDRAPSEEELSPIERWERLPDEERERLRERFERYQRMSAEERRELEERAHNVQRARLRLLERLSDDDRERLRALAPEQREAIVHELLEDELKAEGQRLHAKLPPEWRDRLEDATPEERRKFFADFKQKNRARISLIALENLGKRLELPREEVREMQRLPEQERLGKVLELRKRLQEQSVETYGLPAGLKLEDWKRMLALSPEEFFGEVMRVRETGGWREGEPAAGSAEVPLAERERRAAWDILGQLRPRPTERLELLHLEPKDRRAEISRRRRERVLAILARHEVYEEERLEELATLPDRELYGLVRRLVRESGALEERGAR